MQIINLRSKLLILSVGLVVLVGLAVSFSIQNTLSEKFLAELQKRGLYVANNLAKESSEDILTHNMLDLQLRLNDHKAEDRTIMYIFIMGSGGEILAHTFKKGFPLDLKEANILSLDKSYDIQRLVSEKGSIIDIAVPIPEVKEAVLRIGISEESIKGDIAEMVALIMAITMIVIVMGGIAAFFFAPLITKPVTELIEVAKAVGDGDLGRKVRVRTKDEIGQLGLVFNKMTENLKQSYAQLKETQGQLIQAEKMQAIGRLASGIAHEVKNPLAIIQTGIDYLSALFTRNPEASGALKDLKSAVTRADNIVKDLLDFARATRLNIARENLNSILHKSLLFIQKELDKNHIELIEDLKKDIPTFKVDRDKLEQVFINLCMNAMHAMGHGGRLTVRTYPKKITEYGQDVGRRAKDRFRIGEEVVIVEIEDTGSGIPKDALDKIFEPFFTTRRGSGGTGLGLSVVKNIIDMHGGAIYINNKKDKHGVIVTVVFKVYNRADLPKQGE